MSEFTVSARKYRPLRFSEVVGQEHITTTLKNALTNNRVAHAYLFTGPRGVGKTTTARILAKSLNCESPSDGEPCDTCKSCENFQSNRFIDIIEIDAASNRGIDDVRSLRDSVKFAPTQGKYKVYIIDEVHMLTKESFNAFLKTLEEPPPNVIFIFATTEIQKVPITIVSRCQRYDFRRIKVDTIKEQLKYIADKEEIKIDDKSLTLIARRAEGGLRDAESFFDQTVAFCGKDVTFETVISLLNLIDESSYFKLTRAIMSKHFQTAFEISEEVYAHGWSFSDYLEGYTEHLRNLLTVKATKSTDLLETADDYKKNYLNYAGEFSESDLLRMVALLNKSLYELRYSQNQKIKFELTLSFLIALEKSSTISELLGKMGSDSGEEPVKKKILTVEKPAEITPLAAEAPAIREPQPPMRENTTPPSNNPGVLNPQDALIELQKRIKAETRLFQIYADSLENARIKSEYRNEITVEVSSADKLAHLKVCAGQMMTEFEKLCGKRYKITPVTSESDFDKGKDNLENYLNKNNSNVEENNPYVKEIMENLGGERVS